MPLGLQPFHPSDFCMDEKTYWKIENQYDNASIAFAIEILPTIWSLLDGETDQVTLLDVGARTGAGTALIGYLHQQHSTTKIKIKTTAIDIDQSYYEYARRTYPFSNYVIGDIFKLQEKFDIVLCSHTIEHVPNPKEFVEQLIRISKRYVIIACPFNEVNPIPGHINTFDKTFFDSTGAASLKVYKAVGWHQSMACIAVYASKDSIGK